MKEKDIVYVDCECFSDYPDVVSARDLARMLNISGVTAYKLLKEKKIQSLRIGRTYKIPKVCVLRFLQLVT